MPPEGAPVPSSVAPRKAPSTGVAVRRAAGPSGGRAAAEPRAGEAGQEASASGGSAKGFVEGMALVARGDYAAGAEKLEQYRAAHAEDARAEDAAYMAVVALQRAGHPVEAAAAARRYLAAYPAGSRRAAMQALAR